MRLPNYTASTPPPRSSGQVRVNPSEMANLAHRGEQAKWSGVGAFGRGMQQGAGLAFQAHQHRQAIDDSIEWGTATSRVKDRFNLAANAAERLDVSMDMPQPDDPKYLETLASFSQAKRDEFLAESLKGVEEDVNKISTGFKSEKNKAEFNQWYSDNYKNLANSVRSMYDKKLDSYQRAEMDKMRETAAKNGDIETADKFAILMDKYELITPERAEAYKKDNKLIADESVTSQMANAILQVNGYQQAVDYVMAQDIDRGIKENIVRDIRFDAAQQKLAYDQQQEQIEVNYLKKLGQEQLSEDELMADLETGRIDTDLYKEYANYVEAQTRERLDGEKKEDWDVYDNLDKQVKEFGYGRRTDEANIRKKISEAVKIGKITTAEGRSFLTNLKRSKDPDNPLNRSDVKDGLELFDDLQALTLKGVDSDAEVIDIHKTFLRKRNEYRKKVSEKENLTNKDVEDITDQVVRAKAEEVVLNWFEKLILAKEGTPFFGRFTGTTEEMRLAKKKAKAGIKEEPAETKILTSEIASQYLNLAGGDRKKAEQLAKDDGYSW